jgi:DeoR/GlpR family transcriptional regulator of sugar metabolism
MKTRQEQLIGLLEEQGEIGVERLVELLKVSEATVRRDLTDLQETGVLVRTFGAARLVKEVSLVARTFNARRESQRAEKERIAQAAVQLVRPGMSVALDSGTTVWRVAAALKARAPLSVFTSALAAIEELGPIHGIKVHSAGGQFRLHNLDFIGSKAIAAFSGIKAQIAFVGTDSFIPGKGFFALDEESAALCSAIAGCGDQCVVVMDHTKIGAVASHLALRSEQASVLIVDSGLDRSEQARLANEPFKLILA